MARLEKFAEPLLRAAAEAAAAAASAADAVKVAEPQREHSNQQPQYRQRHSADPPGLHVSPIAPQEVREDEVQIHIHI